MNLVWRREVDTLADEVIEQRRRIPLLMNAATNS